MEVQWQWQELGGMRVLRLTHLEGRGGIRALFTSRLGGVSRPPWHSLNLSYSVGDKPGDVAENRRRAAAALGVPPDRVVMAGLVHGTRVGVVDRSAPVVRPWLDHDDRFGLVPEVDAVITATPGWGLAVTTADCVPVWLYDPRRHAAGLVHAGWRGTAQGAAAAAVAALRERFGSDPADLLAGVGPAIGPCCYEVDEPVRAAFGPAGAGWFRPGSRPGRWQLDLPAANRDQLVAAGLRPEAVAVCGVCTSCRTDLFFSHRKERGRTGRQGALLVLEG